MKKIIFISGFIFCFLSLATLQAQYLPVTYSPDSLSGEIRVLKSHYVTGQECVWQLKLPKDATVRITRINNVNLTYPGEFLVNYVETILDHKQRGEFSEIISGNNELHFVLNSGHNTILFEDKDPIIIIKFAKITNTGTSETVVYDGDFELSSGVLKALGSENYMGTKVSAILGNDYNSYTCFGAINGGRIRGSNEGYLVLEGNPEGYNNPTIYMNRYVANGNIIMTSASGKVGIGIDVPMEKLHLGGAIRGNGTGGALKINTEYGLLELGAQNNTGVHFSTNKPKFFFNQSMDVKGTIQAAEVKVISIENFPDYVFDKDYQLRSLHEVNSFIQTNGHLPEIPSAQEVKENGISLVEMNIKLLQKVEELTLYIIEQDKKMEKLNNRIGQLESNK